MPDGKICLNESGELAVTKFAVEPASKAQPLHLHNLTHRRFGTSLVLLRDLESVSVLILSRDARLIVVDEGTLRRSLFEHTGGSFPEVGLS